MGLSYFEKTYGVLSRAFFLRFASGFIFAVLALSLVYLGGALFTSFLIVCLFIAAYEWWKLATKTEYKKTSLIIGLVYLSTTFVVFYFLRFGYGFGITFILLSLVISSDSLAYVFGKIIKGPKLIERVSPKKTWAGLLGAIIGPSVLVVFFCIYDVWQMSYLAALGFSILIGLFGQAGDLLISMLKRLAKEKDSGRILPGHGGLLDRIDSLILVVHMYFALIVFFPDVLMPK